MPQTMICCLGPELPEPLRAKAASQFKENARRLAITGAGKLKARHVIHAASMGLGGVRTTAKSLQTSMAHSLRIAAERNLSSIAFPAVGTGVSGFPMEQCAEIMLREAAQHLNRETSIQTVHFVLFDESARETFDSVWKRIVNEFES